MSLAAALVRKNAALRTLALAWLASFAAASEPGAYVREPVYDTAVRRDEILADVRLAASRWPDCTTLETAIRDIFRIEGVQNKSDQDRALALWKWFRILVSATGGSYAYEGPRGAERLCHDPHKILTVYGHHQCDGLSWAMAALWRAAGYMALDECTLGHTTAALRYQDADGRFRYHSFDPQHRYYYWDPKHHWVGPRTLPVMRGMVYRHLTAPIEMHSLRTSLRLGEIIERRWDNLGRVVPSGKDKLAALASRYYAYAPGKTTGVYAAAGEERQTLTAVMDPARFSRQLAEGSHDAACSRLADGGPLVHPRASGVTAELIYRLASPYVVAEARCEAVLLKKDAADVCQLLVSRDGRDWRLIAAPEGTGERRVAVDIGQAAWAAGLPNVYTAYEFFVKVRLRAGGDPRRVGVRSLKLAAWRMLNKRTLPNLRPGRNVWRVDADRRCENAALELTVDYRLRGENRRLVRTITRFPHYLVIDTPPVVEPAHDNYDQQFNDGPLHMTAIRLRLVPPPPVPDRSLPERAALAAFRRACPHPADLRRTKLVDASETDIRQTNGFFPQNDRRLDDPQRTAQLVEQLRRGGVEQRWAAAEELGNYPAAIDVLVQTFPHADSDLALFLCKALAQIGDRKALPVVLERWRRAPQGAPGSRYIPDVLAAIGDGSVVPELIAPLSRCRFDFRFHIAHALGELGGPLAERTLEDMARRDPFPAVRAEAARAIKRARGSSR